MDSEWWKRCSRSNSVFLVQDKDGGKHSPLYQMPRSALLVRCLEEQRRQRTGALHGLLILHSQIHTKALCNFLQTSGGDAAGFEYVAMEGHADVIRFRECFRAAWKGEESQVIIISALGALHLLCLGLIRLSALDFIIFDDLRPANYHHPYCVLMEVLLLVFGIIIIAASSRSTRHSLPNSSLPHRSCPSGPRASSDLPVGHGGRRESSFT